jgi:hypothetical protein
MHRPRFILFSLAFAFGLSFACSNDSGSNSNLAGEDKITDVPAGCKASARNVTILVDQVVVEHSDGSTSLLDLDIESSPNAHRTISWQDSEGVWQRVVMERSERAPRCLVAKKVGNAPRWLGGGNGYALNGNFEEISESITDRRIRMLADAGTKLNPNGPFFPQRDGSAGIIYFDQPYEFITMSCPEIGEVWGGTMFPNIGPIDEEKTKIVFDGPRLVNRENSLGTCNLAFGSIKSEYSDTLSTRLYYPDYLMRDINVENEPTVSAAMAQDGTDRKAMQIDWNWDEAKDVLAFGDAAPIAVRAFGGFSRTLPTKYRTSFTFDLLGYAFIDSSLGVEDMPETSEFQVFDFPEHGNLASWTSRFITYDTSLTIPGSVSLRKVTADRNNDLGDDTDFSPRMYPPPKELRINGLGVLSGAMPAAETVEDAFEVEFIADPAAPTPPTHYQLEINRRITNGNAENGKFVARSTEPNFILPLEDEEDLSESGYQLVIVARAYYCPFKSSMGPFDSCPSGWFELVSREQ